MVQRRMHTMTPSQRTSTGATPAPRKWKRRLLAAFVLLFSLLVLSPILTAGTPLRNWLLARALPRFQGSIHIGGASMGWFRPPIITDIEVRDSAGRMLLRIPRLEGNKSLAALLCHPFDLGEYRLTQPVLHVVCSRDSSNLETALAYWLQRKETPSDSGLALDGVALRAVLAQACVILEDQDSGHTWSLDPLDLTVDIPRNRRTPLRVELNATASAAQHSGSLSAEVSAHLVEVKDGAPHLRAEGELRAGDLPLDAAGPFLRRLAPHLQLDGRLNANVKLRPSDGQAGAPDVRLEGNVSLQALTLSDPLLGPDILRLQHVQAPLRMALDGSRLAIEQLEMQSEIGKISLAGTMDLAKELRDALVQPGHRIEAELNLARLADLVPHALHLTKDTRMQSGALSLHLHNVLGDDMVHWEGDLHTSDLEGLYQGQRVTWKEPFAVVLTAHQEVSNPLPVLERLRCDSDFLRLEMSGSVQEWTARGSFNLGRLSEHLAGFVELGSLRVQGEGTLRATARRNPRGGYRLESDVGFTQLSLADGTRAWGEDSLTIRLDLIGDMTGGYRIVAGAMHVLSGKDGIDLDLLEPIGWRVEGGGWRVEGENSSPPSTLYPPPSTRLRARLRLHGDLARWRDRVASLTGLLDRVRLAGQIDADCRLRYESEALHLEDVKIAGRGVRLEGLGLSVDEPTLDFTTSGRWLPQRETLELQHTRLSCPTVTAQAPAATVGIDPVGAWQITASATVQGDMARLLKVACLRDGLAGGALAGRIDLRPNEGRQIVQLDLNVHNLALGSPAAPAWRESRVNLIGHIVYDVVKDSLQIVQLHLDSPTLSCDAAGQLSALSSDMELSLEGKLGYDLEKLEPQLRPYLGPSVKLSGRDVRPFHIAGALRGEGGGGRGEEGDLSSPSTLHPPPSTRLRGDAAVSWQALQALGCQISAAELRGQLANGCFRAAPIEATLNQGRLHLEPSLRLDPLPVEVTLPKERAIEHARLNPSACASALGYAVPVLAGVAQADGEFSLDLQSGRLPLTEPAKSDVIGWITLHSAQVSASPLVQELSVLLKGPATLTLAKDNIVPFRMVNGRVYHTGLELHFPELTIRLSGSVGLDGSLSLTAEMPVPPKWLGSSKLAKAALGNQTIRLPLGGTLTHPKIDEQALREASAKFARDTAENALRQEEGKAKKEAENGLRKLFRRK
jgi:translocation and assembly module TamB